jgi:hypothetical protein
LINDSQSIVENAASAKKKSRPDETAGSSATPRAKRRFAAQ